MTHELSYLKYADLILIMSGKTTAFVFSTCCRLLDGKIQYDGSYAELSRTGALKQLLKECCDSKPQYVPEEEDLFIDEDPEEAFDDGNSVDNVLGTSVLSTVSRIASHRRTSTIRYSHRRRRHSTARESAVSTEPAIRQLTGVEKVEIGRVILV